MKSLHRACTVIAGLLYLACHSNAWAPMAPVLGIGSALFPVRNLEIYGVDRQILDDVSEFFVYAFWTSKVGGGTRSLTDSQFRQLLQSQTAEFSSRYCNRNKDSVLLVGYSGETVVSCAGVQVDKIPDGSLKGKTLLRAPLMSNLAVSRAYRKRGLAEKMVSAVEDFVREDGWEECYLYVEERNRPAVKLYQKLGYKALWRDSDAKTLLPGSDGSLKQADTVLVCMKKDLRKKKFWFW